MTSMYDDLSCLIANNRHVETLEAVGVACKQSGSYLIFDYEITANWDSPFPFICRGLVADQSGKIVCAPMRKFWNAGESKADKIDWSKALAFEKMDGSMVNRWFANGEWHVSTRYNLGEGLNSRMSDIHSIEWRQLIDKCLETVDLTLQPPEETWTYEICSQYNRVVVKYQKPFAVLLSRRVTATGQEIPITGMADACRTHDLSNLEAAQSYVSGFDGGEFEGVVAYDGENRIKIKNPSYVWWHHIRGEVGATWKNMLSVYFKGEDSEFVSQFPDFGKHFQVIDYFFKEQMSSAESLWDSIKIAPTRKEFAALVEATGTSMKGWLFKRYGGGTALSAEQFVRSLDEPTRNRWAENAGLKGRLEKIGSLAMEEE
jgi:hypothetical protein